MLPAALDDDRGEPGDVTGLDVAHHDMKFQLAAFAPQPRHLQDAPGVEVGLLEVPLPQRHVGVHAGVHVRHAVEQLGGRLAFEHDGLEALGPLPRRGPQPLDLGVVDLVEVADPDHVVERVAVAGGLGEADGGVADGHAAGCRDGRPRRQGGAAEFGHAALQVRQQRRADALAAVLGVHFEVELGQVRVVAHRQVEGDPAEGPAVPDGRPALGVGVGLVLDQAHHAARGMPAQGVAPVVPLHGLADGEPGLHQAVVGGVDRDDVEILHAASLPWSAGGGKSICLRRGPSGTASRGRPAGSRSIR